MRRDHNINFRKKILFFSVAMLAWQHHVKVAISFQKRNEIGRDSAPRKKDSYGLFVLHIDFLHILNRL